MDRRGDHSGALLRGPGRAQAHRAVRDRGGAPLRAAPAGRRLLRRRGGARGGCPAWADRRRDPLGAVAAAAGVDPDDPAARLLRGGRAASRRQPAGPEPASTCWSRSRSRGSRSTAHGGSSCSASSPWCTTLALPAAIIGEPQYGSSRYVGCGCRDDHRGADQASRSRRWSATLRRLSAGSRAVFGRMQEAFISMDADGDGHRVERTAERIFGWSADEAHGRSVAGADPARARPRKASSWYRAVLGGR